MRTAAYRLFPIRIGAGAADADPGRARARGRPPHDLADGAADDCAGIGTCAFADAAGSRRSRGRRRAQALLDSVAHHFVSDVPVGVFLSGGMDSTAIVALARHAAHAASCAPSRWRSRARRSTRVPTRAAPRTHFGTDASRVGGRWRDGAAALRRVPGGGRSAEHRRLQHVQRLPPGAAARRQGGAVGSRRRRAVWRLPVVPRVPRLARLGQLAPAGRAAQRGRGARRRRSRRLAAAAPQRPDVRRRRASRTRTRCSAASTRATRRAR